MLFLARAAAGLLLIHTVLAADQLNLMPMPAHVEEGEGLLPVDAKFRVSVQGEPAVQHAAERMLQRLARKTGLLLNTRLAVGAEAATLSVACTCNEKGVQGVATDESYQA